MSDCLCRFATFPITTCGACGKQWQTLPADRGASAGPGGTTGESSQEVCHRACSYPDTGDVRICPCEGECRRCNLALQSRLTASQAEVERLKEEAEVNLTYLRQTQGERDHFRIAAAEVSRLRGELATMVNIPPMPGFYSDPPSVSEGGGSRADGHQMFPKDLIESATIPPDMLIAYEDGKVARLALFGPMASMLKELETMGPRYDTYVGEHPGVCPWCKSRPHTEPCRLAALLKELG